MGTTQRVCTLALKQTLLNGINIKNGYGVANG